jgi:primary-amine oxidase
MGVRGMIQSDVRQRAPGKTAVLEASSAAPVPVSNIPTACCVPVSTKQPEKPAVAAHPLDQLSPAEISAAAAAVVATFSDDPVRFSFITLREPPKAQLATFYASEDPSSTLPQRVAEAAFVVPRTGLAYEARVALPHGELLSKTELPPGTQPVLTPDDCDLAESIVKTSPELCALVEKRYGITDVEAHLVCDPWSIHVADPSYPPLSWHPDGNPARLVQTFLYRRDDAEDNAYAHPIGMSALTSATFFPAYILSLVII